VLSPQDPAASPAAPPEAPARLFRGPYLLLWCVNFFFMFSMSVFVLLPHYLMLRGTTEAFYGAVSGTVGLAGFACAVLLGHWGDRWDRKRAVTLYMLPGVAGSALACLAVDAHPALYFLVRALHGFSLGLGFPMVMAWVVELSPPFRRLEAVSYFGLTALTAGALGPLVGELLVNAQGLPARADSYRAVFLMALAMLLIGVALVRAVPATRPAGGPYTGGGLLPLLRNPSARLVLLVTLNFGGVSFILMSFGKTYAEHLHLAYSSVLFGAFSTGAVASRLCIRPILARVSQFHLVVAALAGVAGSFVIVSLARGYPGLAAAGLLYGVSHGVLYPSLNLRFLEQFTSREIGRASTMFSSAFSLGTGLFPYLGGFVVQAWGFEPLFALAGVITLASLALHWRAERGAG
jgi:MFS family permease